MHRTLVDAPTLRAHLDDPAWLILDARHALADFSAGRRAYEAAHLPGAFFADMEHDLAGVPTGSNGRHPLPEREAFAAFLRGFGANDETQLIVYDAGADMFAARLWMMARWIGHAAVALLDGGFAAWSAAELPTTAAVPAPRAPGNLHVKPMLDDLLDVRALVRQLGTPHTTLLDARGADRFAGQNETIDPVAGHIPGAQNRPFKANFTAAGQFKPAAELRAEFAALGPEPERIVHQCGSGVSACVNLLAMEVAGLPGSRLYPGGWSEWIADPLRPIASG